MKIVLVTGGFDPLHSGHIEYFKAAKQLGNLLIVGINSDAWLARKKGRAFMPAVERKAIIENIYQVHRVIEFNDSDGSAIDAIRQVKELFPRDQIIFANGGDRTKDNIPEMVFEDIEFVFGVGGTNKANSSSWILEEWKAPKTKRDWGYFRVLHENGKQVKLKELTVNPKTCLSMQRHQDRAEHWFVAEGTATVYSIDQSSDMDLLGEYIQHQHIHINRTQWHKLCNETDQPLRVIEIQYGENCVEEDIERK
jgi:D-beta-D-heptose 7-phosphate kinase/D-beta-D-heptose 1-phosphate adenosyltransferase